MDSKYLDVINLDEKKGFEFESKKDGYGKFKSLLLQTGYLTIKDCNNFTEIYTLDYPNSEVRKSFVAHILEMVSDVNEGIINKNIYDMYCGFRDSNFNKFFTSLNNFLFEIPYPVKERKNKRYENKEKYYQHLLIVFFTLFKSNAEVEVPTAEGRIDILVKDDESNPTKIVIFELKIDESAEKAMKQIHSRDYYSKYKNQKNNSKIYIIGVNFSTNKKIKKENRTTFIIEEI